MAKGAITMRERARLSVDVSELLRNPGSSERFQNRIEMDGLTLPLAHVQEGSELAVDLRLDGLVDGVHVAGLVRAQAGLECRRCLAAVVTEVPVDVSEVFFRPGMGDATAYVIEDDIIDLEPMLRDALVLAMPLHPLCRDDCRGLCPTCGADRNTEECGHDEPPRDVRWGPLADLRRSMEG